MKINGWMFKIKDKWTDLTIIYLFNYININFISLIKTQNI